MFLTVQLFWVMACISQKPDFIIVQNPPSIPTLIIGKFVAALRKAWLIIDWHNFGFSILGIKLGKDHKIVRLARWYEQKYGKVAFAHLTVTDALRKELEQNWEVQGKILTVRDKPQSDFKRLGIQQIHQHFSSSLRLFEQLVRDTTEDGEMFLGKSNNRNSSTLLTDIDEKGNLIWRQDRPKLIVSSTSWTEDEDFSILLKAVELYESNAKPTDPRLLFVITGNGPQKKFYQEKIRSMELKKTRIVTAWLEAADYPLLLGSADLGVSLHTSSSGMDLPMKVVDMFGCGLPVCAITFPW
ncbi:MAG: glycosyl transferases group 1-domain-containing protein [Benjaminiella poitrasii]|nr:MAG: glycosyl transferases group 1-domain-containing protein [Benjaminiella poitrasii]